VIEQSSLKILRRKENELQELKLGSFEKILRFMKAGSGQKII